MFDNLPTWALAAGLIVSLLIIAGVVYRALYAATVYMVRRMQDKGEIPEMDKLTEVETSLGAKIDRVNDKIENGLRTELERQSAWQIETGHDIKTMAKTVNRMAGRLDEHLRQQD